MTNMSTNKKKILNDPIYGFITIPNNFALDLIDHPWFQRLRRIKQLGLSHLVYPGGLHTRFHHAIGAMHLMGNAIEVLKNKGHEITEEESIGVQLAILLHDIGHGPFSHALEDTIVEKVHHEDLSSLFMSRLNEEFDGQLDLTIRIFNNEYHKKFLHQLVSSQLDMDRLDYLKRDSFYTGVSEGVISSERIIKMLNVRDDQLVVEEKGIYSIEKFIVARRLMYWQVYLHKTVVAAEFLLVQILKRAKHLADQKAELFCSPSLRIFLYNRYGKQDFTDKRALLTAFAELDDYDIFGAIKVWAHHSDAILARLCQCMIERKLLRIELHNATIDKNYASDINKRVQQQLGLSEEEANYFVIQGSITNNAYNPESDRINILYKNGEIADITDASDNFNISALSSPVQKHFICYPKDLSK
jgi:HD superfamily phosphohydrolase